jgi:tetratricopeptide (TPR) repeat protein
MLGQSLLRIPEATQLLEEVIRRDPRFAPAYTALGAPLVLFAMFNHIQPWAAWEKIQSLADKALVANPRSGAAHELLAAVATYRDWNWAEARRLYARAAELEPGAGFDRFLYAFFLAFSGDVQAALQSARLGRRLDPLNFLGFLTESVMLAYAGDFEAALPLALRPIELDPQFPEGYHLAGYMYLGLEQYDRAVEILEKAVETSHRGAWPMAKLGCALVKLGRHDEARALLTELEQRAHEATMSAPAVATLYLHLGNREEFYRWISRGIDERDPFALSLSREFLWDAARPDPEFQDLLRRVGLG